MAVYRRLMDDGGINELSHLLALVVVLAVKTRPTCFSLAIRVPKQNKNRNPSRLGRREILDDPIKSVTEGWPTKRLAPLRQA